MRSLERAILVGEEEGEEGVPFRSKFEVGETGGDVILKVVELDLLNVADIVWEKLICISSIVFIDWMSCQATRRGL